MKGMITKPMHDAAMHFHGRAAQYGITPSDMADIDQVANGYMGACDEIAAYRGIEKMRAIYKTLDKRCPF